MNWLVVVPLVLGFLAVYTLLPRPRKTPTALGGAMGTAALMALGAFTDWGFYPGHPIERISPESFLFCGFAGTATLFGVLLVTARNPARAALAFAIVVLNVCGIFLLQAAPFLMAATLIVYAGAIVVTFLFALMLSQQRGYTDANDRSREPFVATLSGFLMLGLLFIVLQRTYQSPPKAPQQPITSVDVVERLYDASTRARSQTSLDATLRILQKPTAYFPASEIDYAAAVRRFAVNERGALPAEIEKIESIPVRVYARHVMEEIDAIEKALTRLLDEIAVAQQAVQELNTRPGLTPEKRAAGNQEQAVRIHKLLTQVDAEIHSLRQTQTTTLEKVLRVTTSLLKTKSATELRQTIIDTAFVDRDQRNLYPVLLREIKDFEEAQLQELERSPAYRPYTRLVRNRLAPINEELQTNLAADAAKFEQALAATTPAAAAFAKAQLELTDLKNQPNNQRSSEALRAAEQRFKEAEEKMIAAQSALLASERKLRDYLATIESALTRVQLLKQGNEAPQSVQLSPYGRISIPRVEGTPPPPPVQALKTLPAANVAALGRALYADHLIAVELAGTLLLAATIGAILIAGVRLEKRA